MFQVTQFPSVIELLKRWMLKPFGFCANKKNKKGLAMKIENKNQTVEVVKKRKGQGGRPKKGPSEKRVPALMLRLNEKEQQRLQYLIKKSGWSGDPSSFVRDLVMSEKPSFDFGSLPALEHYLTVLHSFLSELEDEMESESESIAHIKGVISKAAQTIYNNK